MTASMVALRATCRELFAWWVQELRDARIVAAELYAPVKSPCFQLQLFADHGVLTRVGDATGEQRPFKMDQGQVPPLDEVWTGSKPKNARLNIILPEAQVLAFQLQLPPMSEQELKDAMELQLERKLPLPREHLYVDWSVTQKLPNRSRNILVAAARRSHVDQWRDRLGAWGWRVARVSCRDADGIVRLNLLPRPAHRVSLAVGRREALLVWGALSLIVCYSLVTAGQWMYERKSLATSIEEARSQVGKVRQLRAVVADEMAPLAALKQLAESPAAGSALSALSTSLPTDTWLYQTEIRAAAPSAPVFTIEGYTPSAASLVQTLEQARRFNNIQLVEASVADPASSLNRVKLKAQLQPGGQP